MTDTTATNFTRRGRASVLCDGQFGSTGKGVFAAFIGYNNEVDIGVSNAGPNSGHTAIFGGVPKVAYHLPMSTAGYHNNHSRTSYINAGAIVDPDLLVKEMETFGLGLGDVYVHPHACVVEQRHRDKEMRDDSLATKISSTRKGVGEALVDKIRRNKLSSFSSYSHNNPLLTSVMATKVNLDDAMANNRSLLIEVSQGFSLSLNASGFYPYTTSRDCTVNQALSDANVHPHFLHRTVMALRTYPIRVGNIEGLGHSGGCYGDQSEMTWEEVGEPPEYTTVTKRMRRVFSWSRSQVRDAMAANRPTDIFLNFCNYLQTKGELLDRVNSIRDASMGLGLPFPKIWYGYGPNHLTDIIGNFDEAMERLL